MPPDLTVITVTCDQPTGFALCERMMARQTYTGRVQWIVVDDGDRPIAPTAGQHYVRRHRGSDTGAQSLCRNLLEALPHVAAPIVAIVEHDDYYAPTHFARIVAQLEPPEAQIAGDDEQRYYHVPSRQWRVFANLGASLCQTAFRVDRLALFQAVVERRLAQNHFGVDGAFWASVPRAHWALARTQTVVGIKGLAGRPGLGIGHRPQGPGWGTDPLGAQLCQWIGSDASWYLDASRATA